jgi:hypothetical protein
VAGLDDVRRIALRLPGVTPDADGFAWRVGGRLFAWCWRERVDPKRPRLLNPGVIAVRVRDEAEKFERIAGDGAAYFTEPHYDGYAAVLVRLEAIDATQLELLLRHAWRCRAPAKLLELLPEA